MSAMQMSGRRVDRGRDRGRRAARRAGVVLRRRGRALAVGAGRLGRRAGLALARALTGSHSGQSMVEYAFVLALVAIATVVAVRAFGAGISDVFNGLLERIKGAALS